MALTQQQIAEMAGVSRGTVDRVLKNRGHVNPDVEERVRKIIKESGYKVNKAGAALKRSRRRLKFGVIIQSIETEFMHSLYVHLENYKEIIAEQGAEIEIYTIEGIDPERQLELLEELAGANVNGIAFSPVEDERISRKIDQITEEQGIPVVTFNSDIPDSKRMCYVGDNVFLGGRAAAGLMNILLGGSGKVLLITGSEVVFAHRKRKEGFIAELELIENDLEIINAKSGDDNDQKMYDIVMTAFSSDPEIKGIYTTANGRNEKGACTALKELGLDGKIKMVCHDSTEGNIRNLKAGIIDFIIDQDPERQAKQPIDILLEYCTTGIRPEQENIYVTIGYRNKYNID